MSGEEKPSIRSGHCFPSYYPQTLMHDGFWILHYVRGLGWLLGSVLNFTGLRNSKFTGNTDHLAQACDRPEFGELSPDLLTTSSWPLNRWGCQGERRVPEGGFAVIDQWNSDSPPPACLYGSNCARACVLPVYYPTLGNMFLFWDKLLQRWGLWVMHVCVGFIPMEFADFSAPSPLSLNSQFDQTTITPLFAQTKRNRTCISDNPITVPLLSL